jgi:hypothetical protein
MRHHALFAITTVILLSGCQRGISGTYLASDKATVCWLQLVRTQDNHLTGQLAASTLGSDGKVECNSIPISGAVDGENVTLSVSRFFGLETTTLSGTLDGSRLTLTGGQAMPIVFKRSSLSDYEARLNELNASSQAILAAKESADARRRTAQTLQNFVSEVNHDVSEMQKFESEVDERLSRISGVEERYRAITAKITEYVDRERHLAGNPNASVARGQLDVAANQAEIATEQQHGAVLSFQYSVEASAPPLIKSADSIEQACHTAVSPGVLTPSQNNEHITACQQLSAADATFRKKIAAIASGLAHLEQVYVQERNAQQGLLQSAQKLE